MESEKQHFPRDLTPEERALTTWMIEHGTCDRERFLDQLSNAKVSDCCKCGCASIDFTVTNMPPPQSSSLTKLGDFIYDDDAGCTCGCFVFAKDGILSGLEVYAMEADKPPGTLPRPGTLRSWEDRFLKSHRT